MHWDVDLVEVVRVTQWLIRPLDLPVSFSGSEILGLKLLLQILLKKLLCKIGRESKFYHLTDNSGTSYHHTCTTKNLRCYIL